MSGLLARLLGLRKDGAVRPERLPRLGRAPEFSGITGWVNSPPLTLAGLRGTPAVVEFWTSACLHCIRTLPHLNAWHDTYGPRGLAVIGIHTPEFDFERTRANVEATVGRHGIRHPVALDDDGKTWEAFRNRYWPGRYLIDAEGFVRARHFGEGGYAHDEDVIRALLEEAGRDPGPRTTAGDDAARSSDDISLEMQLGFARADRLGSPEPVRKGAARRYSVAREPAKDLFYLEGTWTLEDDFAAASPGAAIVCRVAAKNVSVVAEAIGHVRVKVTLDGRALDDASRGTDVDAASALTVAAGRPYEALALREPSGHRLLRLEFLDAGARCYALRFA